MKITTDHPVSSYGIPVFLDASGSVMDYAPGVLALRNLLGLTQHGLADRLGVSPRSVQNWEQGRRSVPVEALYGMAGLLDRHAAQGATEKPR